METFSPNSPAPLAKKPSGRPHTGRDLLLRARVSEREKARALHEATALGTTYTDYVRVGLALVSQLFRKDPAACARVIARLNLKPRPVCAHCGEEEGLLQVSGRGKFCSVCFHEEQLALLPGEPSEDQVSDSDEPAAHDPLSSEESGPSGELLSPTPSSEDIGATPLEPGVMTPLPISAPTPSPESQAGELWEAIRPALVERVSETNFENWLSSVRPGRLEERTLSLLVPNLYFKEYLAEYYKKVIEEVIFASGRGPISITFEIVPTEEPKEEPKTPLEPTKKEPALTAYQRFVRILALAKLAVGGSLAHKAQDAFRELPEARWNELGQRLERASRAAGGYLSHKAQARVCEDFLNELHKNAKTQRNRRYTTREDHIKRTLAELGKTGPG